MLAAIEQGDRKAADELLPLLYGELRALATAKMARETPGQTLQPTALVHEAWLRLVGKQNPSFEGRGHFFAAAAEAMRRILIEKARRRKAVRHGGGQERIDLDGLEIASQSTEDQLVAVNDALDRLAHKHPKAAQIVKLRYYAGMTTQEAAQIVGVSPDTAKDYAAFARAWLFREIRKEQVDGSGSEKER